MAEAGPHRRPRPSQAAAEHDGGALDLVEEIGKRINRQAPALRQVFRFSIGMRLDYLAEKTGTTREDLKSPDLLLAPEAFWSANDMVLQEWATHTEIWDHSGRQRLLVANEKYGFLPIVFWTHYLPKRDNETSTPSLQFVLHEDAIKLWAIVEFWPPILPRPVRFGREYARYYSS